MVTVTVRGQKGQFVRVEWTVGYVKSFTIF